MRRTELMANKMRRAPSPSWLTEEDVSKLQDFVSRHGGTLMVHNHRKSIRRW